jgi:hypothetical protein
LSGQVAGKVAIVTGGSSGIGEACAETLAREGAAVVVTDIDDVMGQGVVQKIAKAGGKVAYLNHDVRDEAGWPAVIAEAEKRFGRLDIMVANAGIGIMSPIETMTLADWQRQQAINLDGVFLSIKHAIRLDRADVVDRGPARRARSRGLLRDQGRRAPSRKVSGPRACAREHPLQFRASRHHRHADLGEDPDRRRRQPPQLADRSARTLGGRDATGARRRGAGHRQWRALPLHRSRELHDRAGAGDRRRHHRRRSADAGG